MESQLSHRRAVMNQPQLPLFVFGTLRRGHANHHYLEGRYLRVVEASLPGYRRVEPLMIAPHVGSEVDGELFFLPQDLYDAILADCDDLEGIPPGELCGSEYQRKQVQVITPEGCYTAWAYVQPETQP